MIFIKKILHVIKIYFGINLCIGAFGLIIAATQVESSMRICFIVAFAFCTLGSVLLLKKPKKDRAKPTSTEKQLIVAQDESFIAQADHIDNPTSYSDEDVDQPANAYVFDKDGKFLCRADGEKINDADVSNLIRYGYEQTKQNEKASSNPKFHRTVEEHDLIYNFTEKHGVKSTQMCDYFQRLNQKAYRSSNIDEQIFYLQKAIQAFEEAKTWHYNCSKGGKLYFQDSWEHLHNSRYECFSWVDSVQNNLDAQIQKRDLIIPWILKTAEPGFKQTEIYKEFPNIDKSQLRSAIDDLCSNKKISKIKKGNTYWISSNIRSEETSCI